MVGNVKIKDRVVALLIDYVIIVLLVIFVGIAVSFVSGIIGIGGEPYGKTDENIMVYASLFFIFLYYSHFLKKSGQTIGEKVMKIKVVPASGVRISLLAGIIRTLFLAPFLAIIGLFYVSRDPRRTLLDYICFTNTMKD
jgi:uncharacterized RDD family membrane protein YckC